SRSAAARGCVSSLIRGASPLGLPYTLSRARHPLSREGAARLVRVDSLTAFACLAARSRRSVRRKGGGTRSLASSWSARATPRVGADHRVRSRSEGQRSRGGGAHGGRLQRTARVSLASQWDAIPLARWPRRYRLRLTSDTVATRSLARGTHCHVRAPRGSFAWLASLRSLAGDAGAKPSAARRRAG